MALVRSRRIFGPTIINVAAGTLLYTVPAGRTLVVRTTSLINPTGTARSCALSVNGTAPLGDRFLGLVAVGADATVTLDHWYAFDPGDEIWGQVTVASQIQVAMWGALLLGSPT